MLSCDMMQADAKYGVSDPSVASSVCPDLSKLCMP